MNRHMELQFQVECLQDVAVVNCSGRMVRGAALDELRRRIEQLGRVRVLVLDVSEVEQLDAGGLGTLLLVRRWTTRNGAKMKLVNPPVFFPERGNMHLARQGMPTALRDCLGDRPQGRDAI